MGGSDHKDNLFLCCCNCHPLLDAMTEKSYVCANGLEVTEVGIISPQSVGNKGRYEQVCKKITSIIDGSRKKARKEEKRLRYN